MVDKDDLASYRLSRRSGQRFDTVEQDDLLLDPAGRRGAAPAERGDDQGLGEGGSDPGLLLAPNPYRQVERLEGMVSGA